MEGKRLAIDSSIWLYQVSELQLAGDVSLYKLNPDAV